MCSILLQIKLRVDKVTTLSNSITDHTFPHSSPEPDPPSDYPFRDCQPSDKMAAASPGAKSRNVRIGSLALRLISLQ